MKFVRTLMILILLMLLPLAFAEEADKTSVKKGQSICKTMEDLDKDITTCKEKGWMYNYDADSQGCKIVKCEKTIVHCPTESQLNEEIKTCSKNWKYEKYTDNTGCTRVRCKMNCPDLNAEISACKGKNMEYETSIGDKGCKKVMCREMKQLSTQNTAKTTPDTTCKKNTDSAGCISIYCNDGWKFNSCNYCADGATVVDKITSGKENQKGETVMAGNQTQTKKGAFKRMGGWFKGLFS